MYFEATLKLKTARLAEGFEAVCVFVNDELNKEVVEILAGLQVKIIVLRCAGFNNVDIEAASQKKHQGAAGSGVFSHFGSRTCRCLDPYAEP